MIPAADGPSARVGSFDVVLAALVVPPLLLDLGIALTSGHYPGAAAYGGFGRYIGFSSGTASLLTAAVGALGMVAVLVRNLFPRATALGLPVASLAVSVLVAVTGLGRVYPEISVPVAECLLLITVLRRRPAGEAALAASLAVASVVAGCTVRLGVFEPLPLFLLLFVLAPGICLGLYQRWLDWAREQATDGARRDERVALARELHDVVAHHVTGIVVQAQAAQLVVERDPVAASRSLQAIEQAGSDALASMRTMVGALRADGPAPAVPTAGLAEVGALVDEARLSGHPVSVELDETLAATLPDALSGAAYRIVQEALTNVRRHAQPSASVWVRVARVDQQFEVWVANDGEPRSGRHRSTEGGGFGLVGMAERVTSLGGTLAAGPTGGAQPGWGVRALLPLRQGWA